MLVGLSSRKSIQLIVSGDPRKRDDVAVKFIANRGRHIDKRPIICGIIFIIAFILLRMYSLALGIVVLLAIYAYAVWFILPRHRNIAIKIVTDRFVHEKMYISESSAIVGSANLTYSGTHKNVEHIEIIRDNKRIKEMDNHFDGLWKKY